MSSTFVASPETPATDPVLHGSTARIASVLDLTTLETTAGLPARLTNLGQSEVISSVNLSAQNAVANQQAHSQLAVSVLGQAVHRVASLGPLEARSSVDVLSNNETAQTIADLKAAAQAFPGGSGGRIVPGGTALWHVIQNLIRKINARLEGDGTLGSPFKLLDGGPIFAEAPVTFAFPGIAAGSVAFTTTQQAVNVSTPSR